MSRRDFLLRAGGTAIAVPSLAAILAACQKPGTVPSGGKRKRKLDPVGRTRREPGNPVLLPLTRDPIPASTPIETDGVLQVYNWDAYFYKKVLKAFEDEYDVKVEWTTFNNMEEGIQKLVAGQVTADVFFPTTD